MPGKVFLKCEQCESWYDPNAKQCPYCPPQRKGSLLWRIVFSVFAGTALVMGGMFWMDAIEPSPAPSVAPAYTTVPTNAVEPTPTPRPPCITRRDELKMELTVLLISLTNNDINIRDIDHQLDDDQEGIQLIRIRFQAYKPGTGEYPKGQLFVDLDDATCEIVNYDLFW